MSDVNCRTCGREICICAPVPIRKVEIRDGWVYIDGVKTRPAMPHALSPQQQSAAQRGANRRGRKARR